MKILLLFYIPLLLCATPFKVASYNVENLFDATCQGTEYEEYIPGKHHWTKRMAEVKLNHTAEVICDLDADIIGLQEVENASVFHALQKRLKRVGCAYPYGAITHKRGAPIQVALLSHFPLKKVRELQVNSSPFVRNILEVEADVDGTPLTLFVNHWKSMGRRGFESKRIAYAKRLEKRILTMPSRKEYLVLGDLNTNYNAYETLARHIDDTQGKTAINDILKTMKAHRLLSKDQIRHAQRGWHYTPWKELPFRERWSHTFYGHRSTLDHILMPANMFDGKGIDYLNHSFHVFKARYLFTRKGYLNAWEIKHGKHTGKGYSDHLPVVASFDTKPYHSSRNEHDTLARGREGDIGMLYKKAHLDHPVILKNVVVLLKRGHSAILKQSPKGRGIFVFGVSQKLKEGMKLDIEVEEISTYYGLKEITALRTLKERGHVSLETFYGSIDQLRQNEVVRSLVGIYRDRHLSIGGKKIPLYFKKRKFVPANGSKIKIAYAHLGYYKKLQLVIYSKKDFTVLEN